MVCHTEYFILPALQSSMPAALSSVSAVGMAATGLGIAAVSVAVVLAVRDLQREHARSIAIFNERRAEYQQHINEKNREYTIQIEAALKLAEMTYQYAEQDALAEFIVHKLHICSARLAISPNPPAVLLDRLQDLQNQFNEEGESDVVAQQVCRLEDEIFKTVILSGHSVRGENVLAEIEELKQEIMMLPAKMQKEMMASAVDYEKIADKQSQMAMQGVKLLKARVFREILLIQQREAERGECRKLINESLACINAMQKQEIITSYQDKAAAYLSQLQEIIQEGSGIETIKKLNMQIAECYSECEAALQKLSDNEFVKIKLVETLQTMGMNIPQREDNGFGIVAMIDSSTGIDFMIEDNKITTEMVALNGEVNAMPDDVEKGFSIADSVMERLSANGVPLRERYKKSHKHEHGHKLRSVKVKTTADSATAYTEQKKQMRVGE